VFLGKPSFEVADILREYIQSYQESFPLLSEHYKIVHNLLILIRFQDEINYVTVSSWPDHEEPISNWWHLHGRSCGKLRTLWNFGKLWRCYCPRS